MQRLALQQRQHAGTISVDRELHESGGCHQRRRYASAPDQSDAGAANAARCSAHIGDAEDDLQHRRPVPREP